MKRAKLLTAIGTTMATGLFIFSSLTFFDHGAIGTTSGVLAFVLGVFVLIWRRRVHARAKRQWKKQTTQDVVRRLTVDLADCKVVSNNYYDEVPRSRNNSTVQTYDQLYDSDRSVERIEINVSRLQWRDPETGESYLSSPVFKDTTTLKFKMYAAGQTTICVYKGGDYFFDLDFLGK